MFKCTLLVNETDVYETKKLKLFNSDDIININFS